MCLGSGSSTPAPPPPPIAAPAVLEQIAPDTSLEIDVRKTRFLDYDIIEILEDFSLKAKNRNIEITLISERGTVKNPDSFIEFFKLRPSA